MGQGKRRAIAVVFCPNLESIVTWNRFCSVRLRLFPLSELPTPNSELLSVSPHIDIPARRALHYA
jgi:hypothetical protein